MTSTATNVNWAGAAGNAAIAFLGHWIGRGLVLAFRHPLNSGMALLLGTGIGIGAINAMYLQTARHPAPLFMETASVAQPAVEAAPIVQSQPIPMPLQRPVELTVTPEALASSPAPVSIPETVGNKDVAQLQARLTQLGFFAGKIDGYYGPKTADAIRRFETQAGLTPKGAVTVDVIAAANAYVGKASQLLASQSSTAQSTPTPSAAPRPLLSFENDPIGRIAAGASEADQIVSTPASETVSPTTRAKPANADPELVRMVQTGLSRLGFLHAEISGTFDAETARAIREFENYNNFSVTGELTADLVDVLMAAGAYN